MSVDTIRRRPALTPEHRASISATRRGLGVGSPEWQSDVRRGARTLRLKDAIFRELEQRRQSSDDTIQTADFVHYLNGRTQVGRILSEVTDTMIFYQESIDIESLLALLREDQGRLTPETIEVLSDLLDIRLEDASP